MSSDSAPVGVLLMAYGSPDTLAEVEPYYTDVRGGHPPTPAQLEAVRERYERIGGSTPLLAISRAQAAGVSEWLEVAAPGRYRVYLGMRHWHPFIADTVKQMAADGITRAVAIALAPHDSRISIGGYIDAVEKALRMVEGASESDRVIAFEYVRSWHDEPHYLDGLAARVREAIEREYAPAERDDVKVIFSAHSLPERILEWQDPYPAQLQETAASVAARLNLPTDRWTFAFQSAGRTPEPWLGPDIREVITRLASEGNRHILICPVGFISDNLEILYDIDVECQDVARQQGVHVARIEMLNDSPALIAALATVALAATHDDEHPAT